MISITVLLLASSAVALRVGTGHGVRVSPQIRTRAFVAMDDVRECLVDAENPSEIADCIGKEAPAPSSAATSPGSTVPTVTEKNVMGASDSLAEWCVTGS